MAPIRPAWALCTLSSALLFLSGCDKLTHSDTDFARAALERNPDLTIVASDADAKTFTVQVKGSNELHVVRVDQIIGGVPSSGIAPKVEESSASASVAAEAPPPASANEPATANAGDAASPSTPAESAGASATRGVGEVKKSSTGEVLASIGDKSPTAAGSLPNPTERGAEATAATESGAAAASNAATAAGANQKLLASGPGYSITKGETRGNRPLRLAEATELKSPVNVAVERRYEPIICQGNRLVQIDGRNLEFEGDAVTALDGCELHITNSHIIAHGLGLQARAANVHIKNSIIEGDSGSVSAADGAKVYSQQSTFKGLSRRLDSATFTDLGGTRWD